jgi:type IV pilus assembly protein PilB
VEKKAISDVTPYDNRAGSFTRDKIHVNSAYSKSIIFLATMATLAPSVLLSGLGRALVQKGVLKQTDAEQLQNQANTAAITFAEQIIASKKMTALALAEFAANSFGLPMLDISAFDLSQVSPEWIDLKLITSRRAVPLVKRGNRLFVAMSDPTFLQALEEFRFKTNLVAEPLVVEDDKLGRVIAKLSEANDKSMSTLVGDDDLDLTMTGGEAPAAEDTSEIDDAPVVKYIQKILLDAINSGVSDIHFEPYERFYRIRYRLDGVLVDVAQPPLALKDKIATRIKVISKLDIAEKRVPQDGRLKLELSKTKAIDFRVSTLPTLYGEKIVMRDGRD